MRRILIIIVILLVVGTGVWYFYIRPKTQSGTSPVPNIMKPFFPTSTTTTGSFGTAPGVLGNGTDTTNTSGQPTPVFKQLTATAVAGYSVFTRLDPVTTTAAVATPDTSASTQLVLASIKNSTSTKKVAKPTIPTVLNHILRYVSRSNGYVYEINNGAIPLQISNIFIPNIYEADFMDSNNTAVLRFLRPDNQTIATYTVPVPFLNTDGTRTQKSGTYLPDNISAIAVSPDQTQLSRITTDNNGGVVSLSNSIGTNIKTVIHNPFTQWLPMWSNKTLYLQTKAASVADGFFYSVNQSSARLQRIVGNAPGLTASVSPSGTYVLYSQSTTNGFVTKLFNTQTNTTVDINLAILPEKCAWLQNENLICAGNSTVANATYPDDWYAGTTHLSDHLYSITTGSNLYTILYNGQAQSFDMTNVQVDETNRLIYFIDKPTGILWQFSY